MYIYIYIYIVRLVRYLNEKEIFQDLPVLPHYFFESTALKFKLSLILSDILEVRANPQGRGK